MRTEVRVGFDGNDIPNGAWAVLGPAGCDLDVATVEDSPALGQVIVWVTLDATDERLPKLFQLLKQHGIDWSEKREDHYTNEELDGARLLIMNPQRPQTVFGGPRVGTRYDLQNACS